MNMQVLNHVEKEILEAMNLEMRKRVEEIRERQGMPTLPTAELRGMRGR